MSGTDHRLRIEPAEGFDPRDPMSGQELIEDLEAGRAFVYRVALEVRGERQEAWEAVAVRGPVVLDRGDWAGTWTVGPEAHDASGALFRFGPGPDANHLEELANQMLAERGGTAPPAVQEGEREQP